MSVLEKTLQRAANFVPVGGCDGFPRSTRVAGSQLCWLVLLMLVTAIRCPSLSGQTPPSAKLQVGHESWTFKDGVPPDVQCLAQTNDGFLWLCAANGLVRFDGTRFEPFRSPFGDQFPSTNVYSLFAPRSGGLWVGYVLGGFSFLNSGRVTNYASETGSIYRFAQDQNGIVWAGTSSGLWRFDHSAWQHIGVEWNAPARAVPESGFDSQGILWALVGVIGGSKDLIYLMPGTRRFKTAGRNLSVEGFTYDADRFVVTEPAASPMPNSGEGSDERPPVYPVLAQDAQIVDRNQSVWTSPADKPVLVRLPRGALHDAFNKAPPVGSETYDINPFENAALVDREGNIWVGDFRGINRFFYTPLIRQVFPKDALGDFGVVADDNGAAWISSSSNGVKSNLYYVLGGKAERRGPPMTNSFAYRAPDKTFWFSGAGCLWHLVGHDFIRVDPPPEMANQLRYVQTITEDRHGGMWVSFARHGLYRLANGIWTPYGGRDGIPRGTILIAFTDSLGRVWFGYTKNQLAVLDGDRVRVFGSSDGLRVGNILAIYERGSEMWIGGELGLEQFDHGRFRNIAAGDDELLRGISGIVETPDGDLWLNGISGIFHIRKAEISQALKDPTYRVKGDHFGRREGLPGVANQLHPLPTAIEGTDGRLWFTLRNGVVWLDPIAYSEKQAVPPPINIQSIFADDKSYSPSPRLSLPAHTSSVQISYSAVSLSDPEAIRFRYKLQEADNDWHEVATSSPVTYRHLPPGSYHFNVSASDTNAVWSDKIATAEFTILPAFYQTLWFRSLCVILFLATLAGLYQLRLRQLARQYGLRLEERVSERMRIARELHDTLLQSIQGLILKFHALSRQVPAGQVRQDMERALDHADDVLAEGRDRVRNLRGTSELLDDLPAAFYRVAEAAAPDGRASLTVVVKGRVRELHSTVLEGAFSIGREALVNALCHSGGLHVEVEIAYHPKQFCLRVRDNGRGIDPEVLQQGGRPDHWGLQGMRERAGKMDAQLRLWSRPEAGTEVELMVPGTTAYRPVSG